MPVTTGRTVTPKAGATAGMLAQAAQPFTSSIKGPPPQQQPQQQQIPAPQSPTAGQVPQDTSDVEKLTDYRGQLIDQLFAYDQSLNQQYSSPQSQNYIENPLVRQQLASGQMGADLGLLSTLNTLIGMRKSELAKQEQKMSPTEQKQFYSQQLSEALQTGDYPIEQAVQAYRPYLTPNEIVDIYQANVPGQQLDIQQLQSYGYRPATPITKAAQQYSNAAIALRAIDQIDKDSQQARRVWAQLYNNPVIGAIAQYIDPAPVAYQNSRQGAALDLTKALLGLSYPGGANMMMGLIPNSWDSEEVRRRNIDQLKQMALSRMEEAQTNAEGIALGPSVEQYASMYSQPTTAMTPSAPAVTTPIVTAPTTPQYQTSTGKTYSILPSGM